jgi:hypothetical protein
MGRNGAGPEQKGGEGRGWIDKLSGDNFQKFSGLSNIDRRVGNALRHDQRHRPPSITIGDWRFGNAPTC